MTKLPPRACLPTSDCTRHLVAWSTGIFASAQAADPAGPDASRLFREKIAPGAEGGVLFVPLRRGQEAQGRAAARLARGGCSEGGDTGPAVVPGKSGESLLIQAIRHEDGLEMPPKKPRLSDATIADFEKWVDAGRPVLGRGRCPAIRRRRRLEQAREHWAFQPVKKAVPPTVARRGLGDEPDRRLRPREARRARLASRAAGRARRMAPPRHVRPDRPAADARGGRGVRGRPSPRRRRAGGRSAAGQPALRRALGAALARRGPLRRDRGLRIRPPHPRRLAVPRLRHRLA